MRTRDTGMQYDYEDEEEDEVEDEMESESDDEHRFDEERHVPETKYPKDRTRGPSFTDVTIKIEKRAKPNPFDESAIDKAAALIGEEEEPEGLLDDQIADRMSKLNRRTADKTTPGGKEREARRLQKEQKKRAGRIEEKGSAAASDILTEGPIKGISKVLSRIAAGEDIDIESLLSEGKQSAKDIGGMIKHHMEDDVDEDTDFIEDLDRNDPIFGEDLARYDKLMRDLDDEDFAESEEGDAAVAELNDIIARLRDAK